MATDKIHGRVAHWAKVKLLFPRIMSKCVNWGGLWHGNRQPLQCPVRRILFFVLAVRGISSDCCLSIPVPLLAAPLVTLFDSHSVCITQSLVCWFALECLFWFLTPASPGNTGPLAPYHLAWRPDQLCSWWPGAWLDVVSRVPSWSGGISEARVGWVKAVLQSYGAYRRTLLGFTAAYLYPEHTLMLTDLVIV